MAKAYIIRFQDRPQMVVNITPKTTGGNQVADRNNPDYKFMLDRLQKLANDHYEKGEWVITEAEKISYKQYREKFIWDYIIVPAL